MRGIAVIKPALLRFQLLWQGSRALHSGASAAFVVLETTLGCVSALSTCRTRVLMFSLSLTLCIYTSRWDSSSFWSLSQREGFLQGAAACCFSSVLIVSPTRTWGCRLPPGNSSPPQLALLQQAVLPPALILPWLWFKFGCQVHQTDSGLHNQGIPESPVLLWNV